MMLAAVLLSVVLAQASPSAHHVAGGVDFDNLAYSDGPGNGKSFRLHDGTWNGHTATIDDLNASVDDLATGTIGGTAVAIVTLQCTWSGPGADWTAQLFAVGGGRAQRLGILGTGSSGSADDDYPPNGWLHVRFAGGFLYVDVWDEANKCSKTRDWVVSTYAVRFGKLATVNVVHHHRAGESACSP